MLRYWLWLNETLGRCLGNALGFQQLTSIRGMEATHIYCRENGRSIVEKVARPETGLELGRNGPADYGVGLGELSAVSAHRPHFEHIYIYRNVYRNRNV